MEKPENYRVTPPMLDGAVDLSDVYSIPAVFHTIDQSPAASVARTMGRNIIVELMIYVRDNHPEIWQSVDGKKQGDEA